MVEIDHVANLEAIRTHLVQLRRTAAKQFATADRNSTPYEFMKTVREKQAEIEAIDRAIADEQRLEPSNPSITFTG